MMLRTISIWAGTCALALVAGAPGLMAADDAAALLRAARENRETWGRQFPGFTAQLRVEQGGKVAEGAVAVAAAGKVTVQLGDPALKRLAEEQLASLVVHRMPDSPGDDHPTFGPDEPNSEGRLLLLNDDFHSRYRVRDNEIRQVDRTMGGSRFVIDVLATRKVEGGRYLPAFYTVTFRDARTGALQRVESVSERYERVGGYYLPAEQRTVEASEKETVITLLQLRDLRLATAAAR